MENLLIKSIKILSTEKKRTAFMIGLNIYLIIIILLALTNYAIIGLIILVLFVLLLSLISTLFLLDSTTERKPLG